MIQPLQERILVEPIPVKYDGLIVIPDTVKQRSVWGKILAIGKRVTFDVKVGDVVSYTKFCGIEIKEGLMLHEQDLGVKE